MVEQPPHHVLLGEALEYGQRGTRHVVTQMVCDLIALGERDRRAELRLLSEDEFGVGHGRLRRGGGREALTLGVRAEQLPDDRRLARSRGAE